MSTSVESSEQVKVLYERGREKLSSWLSQFGWSKEGLEKKFGHLTMGNSDECQEKDDYLACPFDSGHRRIARENYERHVNRCRLKHENYDRDDIVSDILYISCRLFRLLFTSCFVANYRESTTSNRSSIRPSK